MNYSASLDRLSRVITIGVALLFISIGIGFNYFPEDETNSALSRFTPLFVNLFNGSILLICFLLRPTGYQLTENSLTILRPLFPKKFNYSDIKEVRIISRYDLKWSIRTFGNGGVFGYYGKFFNHSFGSMTWFATRRENFVMLLLKDERKIVITPDDLKFKDDISVRINPV